MILSKNLYFIWLLIVYTYIIGQMDDTTCRMVEYLDFTSEETDSQDSIESKSSTGKPILIHQFHPTKFQGILI